MKKEKRKLKFAIQQIINATWVLRYDIPDDDINRTRKLVGAEPEIVIYEHIRDDRFYNKTNVTYGLQEDSKRIVQSVTFCVKRNGSTLRSVECPVRNKKHIFDYSYKGPIDRILDEYKKDVEGLL